jgi:hypothetical protein
MGGRLSQQGYPFWLPKTGTLFGCGPKASQSILHSAIRSAGGGGRTSRRRALDLPRSHEDRAAARHVPLRGGLLLEFPARESSG